MVKAIGGKNRGNTQFDPIILGWELLEVTSKQQNRQNKALKTCIVTFFVFLKTQELLVKPLSSFQQNADIFISNLHDPYIQETRQDKIYLIRVIGT